MGPVRRSHQGYMNAFASPCHLAHGGRYCREETICTVFCIKKIRGHESVCGRVALYEYDIREIEEYLEANADRIQCVSGTPEVPTAGLNSGFYQFADR
jgi:hypothetical protein